MSERTSLKYFYYALKLCSSDLSPRRKSHHLSPIIKRNHESVWGWIQKYKPKKKFQKRSKIQESIIDERLIKVSNRIWGAIEPIDTVILDICIFFERTMFVAEHFLKGLAKRYGKHPIFPLMSLHFTQTVNQY